MSTLFNKLGGKTYAELPSIPTNVVGTPIVGGMTLDWVNNNTLPDTTNILQLFENSWMDKEEVASGETTGSITGLSIDQSYNIRVAVKKDGLYYPSRTVSGQILPPPQRPAFGVQVIGTLQETVDSTAFNIGGNSITAAGWYYVNAFINYNAFGAMRYSTEDKKPFSHYIDGYSGNFSGAFVNNFPNPFSYAGSATTGKWYLFVSRGDTVNGKSLRIYDENSYLGGYSGSYNATGTYSSKLSLGHPDNLFQNNVTYSTFGAWNRWLSDADCDELWNSGLGMKYSNLSVAQKVSLADWLDCDDWDGTKIVSSVNGVELQLKAGSTSATKVAI